MMKNVLIVGTSKSKQTDAYYIKAKDKFWGLIYQANLINEMNRPFYPEEYKIFNEKTGIYFYEFTDNIVSSDKALKESELRKIERGVKELLKILDDTNAPQAIALNGKTAAGWFYQYIKEFSIRKNPGNYYNKKLKGNYGKITIYNKTEIWVLPNTSGAASGHWK